MGKGLLPDDVGLSPTLLFRFLDMSCECMLLTLRFLSCGNYSGSNCTSFLRFLFSPRSKGVSGPPSTSERSLPPTTITSYSFFFYADTYFPSRESIDLCLNDDVSN